MMTPRFPRLYAAASLKRRCSRGCVMNRPRFPRLYAAASLKRDDGLDQGIFVGGFPRLYAAASLKLPTLGIKRAGILKVFRGSMPRPH